jgi:CheY-like chemotaxis protein
MNILLVEDNNADAFLLTEMFAKQEKAAKIHRVADGYDALDYLFQREQYALAHRPDIILLDLNLPRINGYGVLKELKHNTPLAQIPVVILTTSKDPLDHTQCKALGADICLSKPHGLKGYEEMIHRLMSWAALHMGKPSTNDNTPLN